MNARSRIFLMALFLSSAFVFAREVPVRYVLSNDSVEQDARFVKLARDTVYLLPLDSAEKADIQKADEALLDRISPD